MYFLVDKFDADYADSYYQKDPLLFDGLKGFTWFRDNISKYSHTYPSLPYILSGHDYDSAVLREEYLDSVYKGDTPIKELHDADYRIDLYTQPYHAYNYNGNSIPDYVDNFTPGTYKVEHKGKLAMQMVRMSLYRCMFNGIKRVVGGAHVSTANYCVSFYGDDGSPAHVTDNRDLLKVLNSSEFTETDDKVFSFIHMDGCHTAAYTNVFKIDMSDFVVESFKIINLYLDELKRLGLYESTTVVITGDHGKSQNNRGKLHEPLLTSLFFKPSGSADEPCKQSYAPVCHDDIWPTVMKSAGVESKLYEGKNTLYDYEGVSDRSRWFVQHTYRPSSLDEYFYEIKGNARDWDNWTLHSEMTNHYKRHIMD